MKTVEISVIIPCFNCTEFIGETISSIMSQSYTDFECICIDDESTDNTLTNIKQLIKDDTRFRVFKRPNNLKKGASSCRNYGLTKAKGNYIQWFDADDIMHSRMLEKKLNIFNENRNLDCVICQTQTFENNIKNVTSNAFPVKSETPFIDLFNGKIFYYTPGPLWKKEFLKRCNLRFNEELLNVQEWEFYCRLLLHNPQIELVEEPLIFYRKHNSSIWGKKRNFDKIYSEFSAAKSIYILGAEYKNQIIDFYFLRLRKLLKELKALSDSINKNQVIEIQKEFSRAFKQKRKSFKDYLRYIETH